MREELITLETAKLAKEKGFTIPVESYINNYGTSTSSKPTTFYSNGDGVDDIGGVIKLNYNSKVDFSNLNTYCREFNDGGDEIIFSAPTQSLLQKWLREKHDIIVTVDYLGNPKTGYYPVFKLIENNQITVSTACDSYEEALGFGLFGALKLI